MYTEVSDDCLFHADLFSAKSVKSTSGIVSGIVHAAMIVRGIVRPYAPPDSRGYNKRSDHHQLIPRGQRLGLSTGAENHKE